VTALTGNYYWATAEPAPDRPPLSGARRADICIVGAGFTGLSAGLELAERGYSVVIVDSQAVGWGASGRNGGQLINGYSRGLDAIGRRYGADTGRALGAMALEGAAIIRDRVQRLGIDCSLVDGNFVAAFDARQMRALEHEASVSARFGHSVQLVDRDGLANIVATDRYVGGLLDPVGGHFHPLAYLRGEALAFERAGGTIHEGSRAVRIEEGNAGAAVVTDAGRVDASSVLLCGNAYLGDTAPDLTARVMPVSSQVLATEPLGLAAAALLPANYCVEDANYILDYYRRTADHRLLFGGGVVYGGRDPADIVARLRPSLERLFPALKGVGVDYAWSGNFALTLTRIPQVGRLSPHVLFSHGDSGHGVTTTQLLGRLLAEAIRGQQERFDAFATLPYFPFPGGRRFRVPLTMLGAWYYALRDRLGI
jgi:gamma-glutamylputrescine oxidase